MTESELRDKLKDIGLPISHRKLRSALNFLFSVSQGRFETYQEMREYYGNNIHLLEYFFLGYGYAVNIAINKLDKLEIQN